MFAEFFHKVEVTNFEVASDAYTTFKVSCATGSDLSPPDEFGDQNLVASFELILLLVKILHSARVTWLFVSHSCRLLPKTQSLEEAWLQESRACLCQGWLDQIRRKLIRLPDLSG